MKNNVLSLALLTSFGLALPAIAMAAPANTGYIAPADVRTTPAPNTLQQKIQGPDGELLATQPGEIDLNRSLNMRNENMSNSMNKGNVTPADMRATPARITLQEKIKGPRGELLATQPGEVELSESRRFTILR